MILAGCSSASAGSSPGVTSAAAGRFDLSHWKLTLPVDSSGGTSGTAAEVQPAQLADYSSTWFSRRDDGKTLVFWAPVDGATTKGSHYPRSELRETIDPSDDDRNWTLSGKSTLRASCAILQVPSSSGKIIVGQIHGFQAKPLVKLVYAYKPASRTGSVYALIHPTPDTDSSDKIPLAFGIPLQQSFSYRIDADHQVLTLQVDDGAAVRYAVDSRWNGIGMYFKVGSYVQASGSSSTDGGRVAFSSIVVTHSDNALAVIRPLVEEIASNRSY